MKENKLFMTLCMAGLLLVLSVKASAAQNLGIAISAPADPVAAGDTFTVTVSLTGYTGEDPIRGIQVDLGNVLPEQLEPVEQQSLIVSSTARYNDVSHQIEENLLRLLYVEQTGNLPANTGEIYGVTFRASQSLCGEGSFIVPVTVLVKTQNQELTLETECVISWISVLGVENRVAVEAAEMGGADKVSIDGKEYSVQTAGNMSYVDLPDSVAKTMTAYTYHIGDGADVHTQYPVSMKVWTLKNEDGIYTATRVKELDNILQYSGTSIRVTGKQGIRMITSIDKIKKNSLTSDGLSDYTLKEYGTVVAWASQLENGNPLVLGQSYVMSNYAYKKGIADPVFAYDGNLMQYTNVLVGFSLDQCKDDLAMRPYMILTDTEDNEIILYGGIVQRSIGYIAAQNANTFDPISEASAYDYVRNIITYVYGENYVPEAS